MFFCLLGCLFICLFGFFFFFFFLFFSNLMILLENLIEKEKKGVIECKFVKREGGVFGDKSVAVKGEH